MSHTPLFSCLSVDVYDFPLWFFIFIFFDFVILKELFYYPRFRVPTWRSGPAARDHAFKKQLIWTQHGDKKRDFLWGRRELSTKHFKVKTTPWMSDDKKPVCSPHHWLTNDKMIFRPSLLVVFSILNLDFFSLFYLMWLFERWITFFSSKWRTDLTWINFMFSIESVVVSVVVIENLLHFVPRHWAFHTGFLKVLWCEATKSSFNSIKI